MIQEFDQVALIVDMLDYHLKAGDIGTIVDITPKGHQYTLEIVDFAGDTVAVVAVRLDQVRQIGSREIASARALCLRQRSVTDHAPFRTGSAAVLPLSFWSPRRGGHSGRSLSR